MRSDEQHHGALDDRGRFVLFQDRAQRGDREPSLGWINRGRIAGATLAFRQTRQMKKAASALSFAATLFAFAAPTWADEPNTMIGGSDSSGRLDGGTNVEVPSVMGGAEGGDALLGGAEAAVVPVSGGDGGAVTMDERVSVPSSAMSVRDEWSVSSSGEDAEWTTYAPSGQDTTVGFGANPFHVSSDVPNASFAGWSLSSSQF